MWVVLSKLGRAYHRPADAQAVTVQGVPARCGTFVVLENRLKPDGRTIGLRVVVLPALFKPAANDAVTYLAGGPGDAVTDDTADLKNELIDLNEHHDILLVDQRGTGSNAYYCADQTTTTTPFSANAELRNHTVGCLRAFGDDVNQYRTRAAMDDLDAVRTALGYRQLDVIGSSYGATAAQVYLKLHPASVRTLILVAGPRSMSPPSPSGLSTLSVRSTKSLRFATHNLPAGRRSRTGNASSANS